MDAPQALQVVAPAARHQLPRLSLAAALVLLQVGVLLLRPWPLALAVDHALQPDATSLVLPVLGPVGGAGLLALAAGATLLLSLLLGLLDLVLDRAAEGAAERIGADLRARMFRHALSRSLRWHDRVRSGELVSRMTTDVGRLLDAVVATTTSLVPDTVMVVAVVVLLAHLDPTLAVVALSVIPLLAVLAVEQRSRVRDAQLAARTSSGRLVSTTNDLLRNIRAVQAFGRYDRAEQAYGRRNRRLLCDGLTAVGVEARWAPVGDLVLALGTAQVLVFGGAHVLSGSLSIGALLAVLAYLRDLYSPVRSLARLSGVLAKASASASRVQVVLDCGEAVEDSPMACPAPPLTSGVRLEAVTFGYDADRPCLREVDLEVRAGETVCVWGPSGIGKSTLTYLLLRLYDVQAGRVLVDGVDVRDCTVASLRDRFSYVPQDPWLLDATLAENIAFGNPAATRADVVRAARLAHVEEFVDRLPDGYDTVLGEAAVRLSGGQRRRVALARALVRPAPMLLLDEPTASLDPTSAESVVRAVRSATAARTALVITHDPRLAAVADRVVHLGDPTTSDPDQTQPLSLSLGRR